jgi:hypothetical protein
MTIRLLEKDVLQIAQKDLRGDAPEKSQDESRNDESEYF